MNPTTDGLFLKIKMEIDYSVEDLRSGFENIGYMYDNLFVSVKITHENVEPPINNIDCQIYRFLDSVQRQKTRLENKQTARVSWAYDIFFKVTHDGDDIVCQLGSEGETQETYFRFPRDEFLEEVDSVTDQFKEDASRLLDELPLGEEKAATLRPELEALGAAD